MWIRSHSGSATVDQKPQGPKGPVTNIVFKLDEEGKNTKQNSVVLGFVVQNACNDEGQY